MTQPSSLRRGIEPSLAEWWRTHQRNQQGADNHRVRVFVRSFAPAPGQHGRRRRLIDGLQSATEASLIDGYEVTIVGERICCCSQCRELIDGNHIRKTVDQLRQWEAGEITASGFEERTVDSAVTGEQYRLIVPPELTFGIYFDGELAGVFPCKGRTITYRPDAYLSGVLDQYAEASQDAETEVTF